MLADYRQAGGLGDDWLIPGNHEERLERFIINKAPELYNVADPDTGLPVLRLYGLLGLRELGVQWATSPYGNWPHASVPLSPLLEVRHGWLARSKAGATAHATLEHLGRSVIVGHTHRQAIVYKTRHDVSGEASVHVGIEAGTLARFQLGYAVAPDWQQGFCTARVYPDGTFQTSLATYVNGTLRWEGAVLTRTSRGVTLSH